MSSKGMYPVGQTNDFAPANAEDATEHNVRKMRIFTWAFITIALSAGMFGVLYFFISLGWMANPFPVSKPVLVDAGYADTSDNSGLEAVRVYFNCKEEFKDQFITEDGLVYCATSYTNTTGP